MECVEVGVVGEREAGGWGLGPGDGGVSQSGRLSSRKAQFGRNQRIGQSRVHAKFGQKLGQTQNQSQSQV